MGEKPPFTLGGDVLSLGLNPFNYSVFVHVMGKLIYLIIIFSQLSDDPGCSNLQMSHLKLRCRFQFGFVFHWGSKKDPFGQFIFIYPMCVLIYGQKHFL